MTVILTQGASNGATTTRPPTGGSFGGRVGVVDGEGHAPMRRDRWQSLVNRIECRYHVLEARRSGGSLRHPLAELGVALFEKVTVPSQSPHRGAAVEPEGIPAEHRAVEALRSVRIAGIQAVEVQRAGFVDHARSLVGLCLPDAERGPFGIRAHRHPTRVDDVERFGYHAPTGVSNLRGGLVCALDPDIRVPDRDRRPALGL